MGNQQVFLKVNPVLLTPVGGAMVASITCNHCADTAEWRITKIPPPDIIRKHFIVRGWELRKRPICPSCATKKKEKPAMATTPNAAQQPSEAARKAKRMIYMALEDYYDENAKCYRQGHSDESIAKETGASVAMVKAIRESDFGPIAPPSELTAIMAELSAINARLEALCIRNGWVLPGMGAKE